MPRLLARFWDVREGEGLRVFQASAAIFLLLAGHTMLETARDTLFLQRLEPSRLTLVYGLIAALTLAASPISVALARRFGRRNALVTTLLAAAYGTAVFYLQATSAVSVFALYTWSGLLGSLLVLQFWLFAGEILTVAQGKRLFGPIAAGGALGAVSGAAIAAGLLAWLKVSTLLIVAAAIFVLSALVLTTVSSEDAPSTALRTKRAERGARAAVQLMRTEPYVLRLAALAVLSSSALLATDYLFKATAARDVPGRSLGTFFAGYYAALNLASLLMQLFATGPLLRRVGVVPALAVLPSLLLAGGATAALAGASLGLVLLVKSSDGALRHSINRVATELVEMPLPAAVQERTKAFVDGPLPRIAQAATAAALLSITSLAGPTERWVAGLAALLALGWLFVAVGLRKPYLQRFREALAKPGIDHSVLLAELDVNGVEVVLEALSSTDPSRAIGAMELLSDKQRVRLIPALILRHDDEQVLVRALEILAASDRVDWLAQAERLLSHGSETVRAAALRALSRHGQHPALERGLSDPSPVVRAHAAFWLVTTEQVPEALHDPRIEALFALDGESGSRARHALVSAIQDAPDPRWTEVLLAAGPGADARLFEQVALAMTRLKDPRFVAMLIPRLAQRDGRGAVRDALVALGAGALDALEAALVAAETPHRVRVHVPRTISRFDSQRAADILLRALGGLEQPGLVRYKALRGLGRLVAESRVRIDHRAVEAQIRRNLIEHLRVMSIHVALGRAGAGAAERSLRLVLGLLDGKLAQSLERAFRLLQIRHKHEDLRSVYFALKSPDRRTRAHALEFLDLLTAAQAGEVNRDVRELLLVIGDELAPAETVARARHFLPVRPATPSDALELLIADRDESIAAFAAYHALEIGSTELTQRVARALRERPNLNRGTGRESLFPSPIALGHAT